ncbi:MAG: hypothetical protein JWQ69_1290, partial [Pseudomonas sp.]|nr:hypothetical protein [Pseudomonas sp.]
WQHAIDLNRGASASHLSHELSPSERFLEEAEVKHESA